MQLRQAELLAKDLEELKNTQGSKAKAELARGWIEPYHKEFLDLVGNKNRQWYVTWDGVSKGEPSEEHLDLGEILYAAESRLATPTQTADRLQDILLEGYPEIVVKAIVDKTLDAGITVASVKKALGTRPTFKPALAADWLKMKPAKQEKLMATGAYVSTPKMDGLRCLMKIHSHDRGVYSRTLKPLKNMDHFIDALEEMVPFPCWIDGEALAADGSWNSSVTGVKKEGARVNMQMYIFDMITVEEADTQDYKMTSKERIDLLNKHIDYGDESMFVEVVRTPVYSIEEAEAERDMCIEEGWEGSVLHRIDKPYSCKRTDNWIKLKKWLSSEFVVTGFNIGTGKHRGRLGTIAVEGEYEGKLVQCEVGTGFKDHERHEIWDDQESFLHKEAEIKFFEVTESSLRFPVFLRWRTDK